MMKYEYIGNKSGGILFELTGIRYTRTHCGNSRGQFGISTVCVMFKFSWDFWKLWTLNAQKFPDANGFVMLCPKTQVDHQLALYDSHRATDWKCLKLFFFIYFSFGCSFVTSFFFILFFNHFFVFIYFSFFQFFHFFFVFCFSKLHFFHFKHHFFSFQTSFFFILNFIV